MKKAIALLVCLCAMVSCMAGCTMQKKQELITVTLWHYYDGKIKTQFDNMVQEFNETTGKEKGILVDAYSKGGVNQLADAVLAAANEDVGANKMPNIFAAYSDSVYRLDKLGVVAELDQYFDADELAAFRTEFLEDGRLGVENGPLKIIPIAKSTELLFVDNVAFAPCADATGAKLEDMQTWEGLVETAKTYYEWSGGQAMFGIDSMSNFMIQTLKQLGEDIFQLKDGKATFNLSKENAKKLWEVYAVPMMQGYFAAGGQFRSDDVKSGKIISFTGSNSSASFFPANIQTGKETGRPTEPYVMPYPHFADGDLYSVHQGAGMALAKTDETQEKASIEFLKWLTDGQRNLQFAVDTAYLPVKNDVLDYKKTIAAMGAENQSEIKVATAKALYDMMGTYTLHASDPFDKSFETRNVLNTSLNGYVTQAVAEIEAAVAAGGNRQELAAQYSDDAHFTAWYEDICKKIGEIL